jgi:ADP-heptose:LPS heptosyltransferase
VTRAPQLIGYGTNERKKLFTHAISYSQDDYEVESFYHLLTPLTGEVAAGEHDVPFLTIPADVTVKAKALLSHLPDSRIVAMFPGSSINERKWGSDRLHQTAKLLGEQGCSIVVVGGKDDVKAGHQIVSGLSNSLNLCGKLTLPETAAILKESSLLITGDSGIMHIGYGLGIKVLALFGPGREKKWGPRGKDCKVINKHLPCSPCTTFGDTPKCMNNAACMGAITVEEVVREALALLDA